MSIFDLNDNNGQHNALAHAVEAVSDVFQANAHGIVDEGIAGKLAMESASLTTGETDTLRTAFSNVKNALLALENEELATSGDNGLVRGQLRTATEAAAIGAVVASGLQKHLRKDPFAVPTASGNTSVISNYLGAYSHPRVAAEAYDETQIRNSVISTTVLNYRAARQNAFGEMFFGTVVMAPDQSAYHMQLEQINVMKEVRREISGAYKRFFNRVNLIKAQIDHTILEQNDTDVVPVVRTESIEHFVAAADVAPYDVTLNGVTFKTAPLKMGTDCGLIDISQNDALLSAGILDHTDALDPAIQLKALYLKVGADVLKLDNLGYLTTSNFVPAPQGDSRAMILSFNSQHYPLNKTTTKLDGSDLTGDLAAIKTNDYVVRLRLNVSGNVNLQDTGHNLNASPVTVAEIRDKDGELVDLKTTGKTIADAVAGGQLIGYDLKARRTNSNKRTRGQLLDMSAYSILYTVPLLAPISTNRPLAAGEEHSQSDLAALITATRCYTSNSAVTTLFNLSELLSKFTETRKMGSDVDTEYMGIYRKMVQFHYEESELDVAKVVASLKSDDRPGQVQAVLVNKIRDMVFRAWYASGLQPAADAVFAGEAPTPIVKIGCDPIVARYLQVQGDLRTIGGQFAVQIESSWDARMTDNIFIGFGYQGSETGANVALNFGMMLWKPEVVIAAPIYRQGQTSTELTVQPSFLHVMNTPIMMRLRIKGIKEAMVDAVPVNINNVTPAAPAAPGAGGGNP